MAVTTYDLKAGDWSSTFGELVQANSSDSAQVTKATIILLHHFNAFFAQAQGSTVIGQPAFQFLAPGSAGKFVCSVNLDSKTEVEVDNSIDDYEIQDEHVAQGISQIVTISMNTK